MMNSTSAFTIALLVGVAGWLLAAEKIEKSEKTELWVISGQSNACGRAPLPGLDPDPRAEMYDPARAAWVPAQEPIPGMNGTVGPWIATAREYVAKSGTRLRLVGSATGGTPIRNFLNSRTRTSTGNALRAAIKDRGQHADVFLWYQGENDAYDGRKTEEYLTDLKALVAEVRTLANHPGMTILVVQIGSGIYKEPRVDFMPIREAQRQFVVQDGNALLVTALGRKMGDYVHLGREGYFELGGEMARALVKTRLGRKDVDWPGPVLDAAVLGADGTVAVAHFAEVNLLSGCRAKDFAAVDADGVATCVTSEAGKTVVNLVFERAVKLPANLVYGYGQAPAATLTDEAGNRAPAVHLEMSSGAPPADAPGSAPNGAGKSTGR
ncbi:MAG: sialate O-acetylesterase [Planctomycetota bacterium]